MPARKASSLPAEARGRLRFPAALIAAMLAPALLSPRVSDAARVTNGAAASFTIFVPQEQPQPVPSARGSLAGSAAPAPCADMPPEPEPELRRVDSELRAELGAGSVPAMRSKRGGMLEAVSSDTIWIGFTPGHESSGNYWSIWSGRGAGFRRPAAQGGMWDFESALHGDSLQGWWPIRGAYTFTGAQSLSDWKRPWWAFDAGNNANYAQLSNGRTFGVVGVWHRDNGNASPGGVAWAPLEGSYSAWMGLRSHGDVLFTDAVTGNAFNEDVLQMNGQNPNELDGSDKTFPGYGSQMDQMLYRDIVVDTTQALTVSFRYRTSMSTSADFTNSTRTGWFDKDPLQATAPGFENQATGNFISSTDAGNALAPRDSFMIYVGAAANDAACVYSDGSVRPVFDPLRRWFSEVLRANEQVTLGGGGHRFYQQLESVAGTVAPILRTVTLSPDSVRRIAAGQGRVRLVFRVKTNRKYDDETFDGYTSGGAGAAVVDDVKYQIGGGSMVTLGDFESPAAIDNSDGDPIASWKSTGKPPGAQFHAHALSTLLYEDLCGSPGSASRVCNMAGVVVSAGDHDHGEAAGGLVDGTADRERIDSFVSPTIQLVGPYPSGGTNAIGLASAADAAPTGDYYIAYEIYTGVFDPFEQGNFWRFGFQSYPALNDATGQPAWGEIEYARFNLFDGRKECLADLEPVIRNGLLVTSNASGIPDSVRIVLTKTQECFAFGQSSACSSTDGAYFDDISLAIIDGAVEPISVNPYDFFQDCFPANENPSLPGIPAAFDTTAALIKTGRNLAAPTGNNTRYDIPGDSIVVATGVDAGAVRVDLVFRILPGPGNYRTLGRPGLPSDGNDMRANHPNNPAALDQSDLTQFWSSYMADNGAFGTGGNGTGGPGHPGPLGARHWDPNLWNSARCDTAETNLFALQGRLVPGGPVDHGAWMSTYHESDPRASAAALGIARNRCFVMDPLGPVNDITCSSVPAWVTSGMPGTGYDGNAQTVEGTKIIPDGLLTPGAHIQYFFRKSVDGALVALLPDTSVVYPQGGEGSLDGHRWQEVSVLPDRWKDPAYQHPVLGTFGSGLACMLVLDWGDRRGNERAWVSIADTIGATAPEKWGANNGWHAAGTQDVNDPAARVARHGGQAGTTWDLYQVKGGESPLDRSGGIGNRYAYSNLGDAALYAKRSRQGPTDKMLATYYDLVLLLTGDLDFGVLGPFANQSSNDVGILDTWLGTASVDVPRGIWAMGDGLAQDLDGIGPPQATFLGNRLFTSLVDADYLSYSHCTDLVVNLEANALVDDTTRVYGLQNRCTFTSDVLGAVPDAGVATAYHGSVGGDLGASVAHAAASSGRWTSLTSGWNLGRMVSQGSAGAEGRTPYISRALEHVFGEFCTVVGGPGIPVGVEDTPAPRWFANRARIALNPSLRGRTELLLTLERPDRVDARVYDLRGRLVRTLASRAFAAGEHRLAWNGLDDAGQPVAPGVYFTRVRFERSGFTSAKKLTILR